MAMAILIPDSCPSRATVGEKRIFGLLRDTLPDHFTAWYEPIVAGRHPDFTLVSHDFSLLMLEIKGWYAGPTVLGPGLGNRAAFSWSTRQPRALGTDRGACRCQVRRPWAGEPTGGDRCLAARLFKGTSRTIRTIRRNRRVDTDRGFGASFDREPADTCGGWTRFRKARRVQVLGS
jgi:hypothetical protein